MTERLMIGLELTYEPSEGHSPADAMDFFELVMEHLVDLGVEDAGVGLDTEERRITITATAEGGDVGETINTAIASIRTAIHAVGGETPEWPTFVEGLTFGSVKAEPVGAPAAPEMVDA